MAVKQTDDIKPDTYVRTQTRFKEKNVKFCPIHSRRNYRYRIRILPEDGIQHGRIIDRLCNNTDYRRDPLRYWICRPATTERSAKAQDTHVTDITINSRRLKLSSYQSSGTARRMSLR
jgi:hypothetical protein